jgi:multicomponent Na+:H+ antiporter subunit E
MGISHDFRSKLRAAAWRGSLLAVGWWALLEADPGGLLVGVPVVLAAATASVALSPPRESAPRPSAVGVVRLVWYFLVESIRGGWDVARRALSPRLPLSPVVVHHSSELAPGAAQTLFTSVLALMPGTLSIDSAGHDIRIHALVDRGDALTRDLRTLEAYIARALTPPTRRDGPTDA